MKPIITISPPMQNLIQKPLLLAACARSACGRECTVRGASKRLSPPVDTAAASGAGAVARGSGGRVAARPEAIDGSAPSRAAHASQNRASARLRWPHSGQMRVDELRLNIAPHFA